jgi:RNA polymerase sigma-70 factor (ECF subfamily)
VSGVLFRWGRLGLEAGPYWVYGDSCSGFGPFCSLYRWRIRVVESLDREINVSRLSEVDDLDRLYREQASRMWRALTAYAGSRDVAQDAVAEAFAQAIARGGEIRSPERWVWKAAYRIAAGELKRRGTLTELVINEPVTVNEPAWEVRAALARLSPMQRSAVVLHYYAGYPASEIARITSSTPAAVWVHLSRGRRHMAQLLEENDD